METQSRSYTAVPGYTASVDEVTRALIKLVKRPMQRWWLKVGAWWLGALFLIFLFSSLCTRGLCPFASPRGWLGDSLTGLVIFADLLFPIIILLVSTQVIAVCWRALDGVNYVGAGSISRSLFLAVLVYCLPAFLAFFVYLLIDPLVWLLSTELTRMDYYSFLYYLGTGVYRPGWHLLPFVLWLIVLQIVLPEKPWFAWLWYIVGCFLFDLLFPVSYFELMITGTHPLLKALTGTWAPELHANCGWLIGLVLVWIMFRSLQSNSKRLGYTIGGVLIAAGFLNNYNHRIPLFRFNLVDHPNWVTAIDFWRSWHSFLTDTVVYRFKETIYHTQSYYELTGVGELTGHIPVTWSVATTGWVVCYLPLAHLVYIAAVIAFIYYVILAPPRSRSR